MDGLRRRPSGAPTIVADTDAASAERLRSLGPASMRQTGLDLQHITVGISISILT